MLRPYHPALDVEPWAVMQVVDAGDVAVNPFSIAEAITTIADFTRQLLARCDHIIAIGGDHTIALPLLRATSERHGPVALVHFDAHLDTWDTYFGEPYTHGTPFRRAVEEGLLDLNCSAHVGIRSPLYSRSDLPDDAGLGFAVISTADVAIQGIEAALERIRTRVGDRPVYVSIDVDVPDPAHAPGTGTPEPGGLTSREVQMMLRGLQGLKLVGADVVEVAPAYDHAEPHGLGGRQPRVRAARPVRPPVPSAPSQRSGSPLMRQPSRFLNSLRDNSAPPTPGQVRNPPPPPVTAIAVFRRRSRRTARFAPAGPDS